MSIYKPASRTEFKAAILRRLGSGVIDIDVTDDQVEDAIEEAIKYFSDYHFDGSEHVYYVYPIQAQDVTNRYITIPDSIIGVTDVYSLGQSAYSYSVSNMFSGGYSMAIDFAFNLNQGSMVSYYTSKAQYDLFSQMLVGQTPLRFNRHTNRVYIDVDWGSRLPAGSNLILDAYSRLDPDVNTDIWNDRWLLKYAAAKVKYVWGSILSKYDGVQLPAGGTLNGPKIQDDAAAEIQQLEDEMLTNYSVPPRDIIA